MLKGRGPRRTLLLYSGWSSGGGARRRLDHDCRRAVALAVVAGLVPKQHIDDAVGVLLLAVARVVVRIVAPFAEESARRAVLAHAAARHRAVAPLAAAVA